uniref:SCAN box domain-containing protein n=1 Tax=Pygocentrus nattereri TaxID=42514 RepID=A0AAR2IK32_PYGNA
MLQEEPEAPFGGGAVEQWLQEETRDLRQMLRQFLVEQQVRDTRLEQEAEAILKYSINAETYRQRFHSLEVSAEETPKEVYVRLRDLYQKWVKPTTKPVKQIGETIILEQFLRMLCPELQVWIREHDPPSAEEAARLADNVANGASPMCAP